MIQRTLFALLLVSVASVFAAENEACEKLIECEAQAKAKWELCSVHNSTVDLLEHHESSCHNFTEHLHEEIHELTEEKSNHYGSCLKRLSPNASDYPLKGKKRAKCISIKKMKVNPSLKNRDAKTRRAAKEKKEKKNNAQKQCFRDVKKIRSRCHQYAKCCPIAKKCRDTSEIDKKLQEKKKTLHDSHKECRKQRQGKKKNGNGKKKEHKKEGLNVRRHPTSAAPVVAKQ
ncbi:hypothetical protein L596_011600 [Steinernema carpocapsae]|uniref:Uncharacterized protein n=1 Tax=Steinernema carpocapsae TaxID=34508 RepID=A0A4U5NUF2_STECR|nr:hypothetical protein L596_011600 [Steinernema carpocapsae]